MNIGIETILNMIPGGVMPIVYVNQYDTGYQKKFRLFNGAMPFNIASNQSVTIRGTKGDGHGIINSVQSTVGSNVVSVTITEQMTAVKGVKNIFELRVVNNSGLVIGTANFIMFVERAALNDDTVISDSDLSYANDVYNNLQSVEAYQNQLNIKIQRYDTVVQMKADSALKNGDYARTGGYYAVNDGGGALYRIYSTAQTTHYETLVNGLYATLVVSDAVTPEQCGAYGDGTHDDTSAVIAALNYGKVTVLTKEYLVDSDISVIVTGTVICGGGTIRRKTNSLESYAILSISADNVTVKDISVIGDRDTHTGTSGEWGTCVVVNGDNFTIDNVRISKAWGDGVYINGDNCVCANLLVTDCSRNGISVIDAIGFHIHDCTIIGTNRTAPMVAIDVEPNDSTERVSGIINNIYTADNTGGSVRISLHNAATDSGIIIDNVISDNDGGSISSFWGIFGLYVNSTGKSNVLFDHIVVKNSRARLFSVTNEYLSTNDIDVTFNAKSVNHSATDFFYVQNSTDKDVTVRSNLIVKNHGNVTALVTGAGNGEKVLMIDTNFDVNYPNISSQRVHILRTGTRKTDVTNKIQNSSNISSVGECFRIDTGMYCFYSVKLSFINTTSSVFAFLSDLYIPVGGNGQLTAIDPDGNNIGAFKDGNGIIKVNSIPTSGEYTIYGSVLCTHE